MAKVTRVNAPPPPVPEPTFQVELSSREAGYLFDLLYRHISGDISRALWSLGSQLEQAGADLPKYRADNVNEDTASSTDGGEYRYENRHAVLNYRKDSDA